MAIGYEMSLQDYLRVISKRRWIILVCAFTIFVTAIVYTSKLTPRYVASGRVELNYQSTLASLLADALLYKGNELATAIQFASSMPVMERAARELGMAGAEATKAQVLEAAARLQGGVGITGDGQTNFITITFQHSDPRFCAAAVDAIAAAFAREYRARNTRDADQIKMFLEEQMRQAEQKLIDAENQMLLLRQSQGGAALEPNVQASVQKLAEVEAELGRIRAEKMGVEASLKRLVEEQANGVPGREATTALERDQGIRQLKKQLFDAEVELATRLKTLTPRHPEVRAVQDTIRKLRTELELLIGQMVDGYRADLEARVAALGAREEALARMLPQVRIALEGLPRHQVEVARIQRSIAMNEKLFAFFRDKLEEKKYDELVNRDNAISVIERAAVPTVPVYPNRRTNAMIGIAIGLMLGLALAFVVEAMDTSIGTIEDVERTTGLSVLGVIPSIAAEEELPASSSPVVALDPDRARARDLRDRLGELESPSLAPADASPAAGIFRPQLVTFHDPKSPISEAYRTLRTNVQFKGLMGNAKTLTITSSGPQEGKTTTLCNLAVTMAQSGQRVLAVGCNLRRPALHKMFGIRKKPGLTDVLIGARQWQEVVQETGIENLSAFCSGPIPPNPSELLGSPEMTELIRQVREAYDVILLDCPPVLPVTDAAVLSSKTDAVLLVYYVGRAAREALLRAKVQLENVGAKLLGVVLNQIPAEGRLGYSYYYYHYHYYGETAREDKLQQQKTLKRKRN